jgi:hypothetical protein
MTADYEIHGNGGPWTRGNRERGEEPVALVARCLGAGTGVARRDVPVDEATEARPVEVAGDELVRLGLAEVTCGRGVVALAEDLELDRVAVWDVHEAVEKHKAVVEAETCELALNVVVSGNVEVAQEWE